LAAYPLVQYKQSANELVMWNNWSHWKKDRDVCNEFCKRSIL